jgi:peptide chain release factor subunit 1
MALVTEDAVRTLAGLKGSDAPVVSVYLDVDGRRYPRRQDYELALERLLRGSPSASGPLVAEDVRRIEAYVRGGIDRSQTRGLALFACSAHGLWETIELSVAVHNQLVINHTPQVRQLEAVVHNHARFGVLVVDRQRARMFVFEQGQLVDRNEQFDQLPRHDDDHGGWDRDHVRGHTAALAHAHLRRAGAVAFEVYRERPFDHLILSAPPELATELERELHTYLRDRIAARVALPAAASVPEIRRVALELDAQVERDKERALVDRLINKVGAGIGAVAGLDAVLNALVERRVETLLVSQGFVVPGLRCWVCDHVAAKGKRCPSCGGDMTLVEDVVEEAVEVALGQACRVATCEDNADLDVHGRIGALLRF